MDTNHPVVSKEAWLVQRRALLEREKALTHQRDQIARERRALPWVRIDKPYVFDTPAGRRTLAELFEGRRQLMVQHFMLGPGWEAGCVGCSFMADHIEGASVHVMQRDVTLLVVSRAPLAEIERFRQRMGWRFKWVSSFGSDFNHDFGVSFTADERARGEVDYNYARQPFAHEEAPGISAFCKNAQGEVFHTYSTYHRGAELTMGAFNWLDLVPKGRNEDGGIMNWVKLHDEY